MKERRNVVELCFRNLYDALTPDENQSQYESLHMAGNKYVLFLGIHIYIYV